MIQCEILMCVFIQPFKVVFLEIFKKGNVQVSKVLEFSKEKVQPLKFLKVFKNMQLWYNLYFQPKCGTCFQKLYTVYFTKLRLVVSLDKPCILYNDETY